MSLVRFSVERDGSDIHFAVREVLPKTSLQAPKHFTLVFPRPSLVFIIDCIARVHWGARTHLAASVTLPGEIT